MPLYNFISTGEQGATGYTGYTGPGGAGSIGATGILSSITGVDLKSVGVTTLFTVPTGKTATITQLVVRVTTGTAVTVPPTLGIGVAAGEDDIIVPTTLTGLNLTGEHYVLGNDGISVDATSTQVIKLGVDVGAAATTMTATIDLVGYLT